MPAGTAVELVLRVWSSRATCRARAVKGLKTHVQERYQSDKKVRKGKAEDE